MIAVPPRLAIPYPGLRPFQEEDHLLFFGRHEQSNDLLTRLEDAPFTAVVGSSGSGKSSLVRAGLLPLLRGGFLFGAENWKIAVARPGHDPYLELARRLAALEKDVSPDDLLSVLRRSDNGLLDAIGRLWGGSDAHVLVVIDQFEELFGFRRTGEAGPSQQNCASRDEASAFVSLLLAAARKADQQLRLVLTMRSDFVGDCEVFLGLPQAVSQSQFLVPRLTRSQMDAAITAPGRVHYAAFAPFEFEPGLVNTLINEAGDRTDQLPLLQHALMRTWKESDRKLLTELDYTRSGRIERSLSDDADTAWHALDDKGRELARRLFLLLCDVSSEGHVTRRRPLAQDVMDMARTDSGRIEQVVRVFQADDRNFLLPPAPEPIGPGTILDISHESLLRQWGRLKAWQTEERDSAAQYTQLAITARRYAEGRADLLSRRDLETATEWFDRTQPTAAWGDRYAPGQAEAVSQFLKASREAEAERLRVERLEQESRRQLAEEARHAEARRLKEQAQAAEALLAVQASNARRMRLILLCVSAVAIMASVACVVALVYKDKAERATARAEENERTAREAQFKYYKKAQESDEIAKTAKNNAVLAEEAKKETKAQRDLAEETNRELARHIKLLGMEEALRKLVQSNERLWSVAIERIETKDLHTRKVPSADAPSQSFAAFLQSRPQQLPKDLSFAILPVGPINRPKLIEDLRDFISCFFQRKANILAAVESLELQQNDQRNHIYEDGTKSHQWRAESVLKAIRTSRPSEKSVILVITEHDLFSEGLRTVYGYTDVVNHSAIISTDGFDRQDSSAADSQDVVFLRRTLKVAAFVTAQIFGIRDFAGYHCNMNPMVSGTQLDSCRLLFCPECERKIWWLIDCDPIQHYRSLMQYASEHDMKVEEDAFKRSLEAITTSF